MSSVISDRLSAFVSILIGLLMFASFLFREPDAYWPITLNNVLFFAAMFLLPVVLIGLHSRCIGQSTWLVEWMSRISLLVSFIGMLAIFIGYIRLSLSHFSVYPPRGNLSWHVFMWGLFFLNIGLIFFSIANTQTNALLRLSLFVTGVIGTMIFFISEIAGFWPFLRELWIPFGVGWIVIGYAIWYSLNKKTRYPEP